MGVPDEQVQVSERMKREIERRRRKCESYNAVLERPFDRDDGGDFYEGFGRGSDEEAERVSWRQWYSQGVCRRAARSHRVCQ